MSEIDSNGESPKVRRVVRRRKKTVVMNHKDSDGNDPDSDAVTPTPVPIPTSTIETIGPLINLRRSNQLRQVAISNSSLTSSQERLPYVQSQNSLRSPSPSPRSVSPGSNTPRSLNSSPRRDLLGDSHRQFVLFAQTRIDITKGPINFRGLIGTGSTASVSKVDVGGIVMAAKTYYDEFFDESDGSSSSSMDGSSTKENLVKKNMQLKLDAIYALPPHPHILKLFGYRFTEELIVLTELMDCTLRDVITERRKSYKLPDDSFVLEKPPFSIEEIIDYFEQIMSGVSFLHNIPQPCSIMSGGSLTAILHRDLNSDNVLVNKICSPKTGQCVRLHLKISDFGEARIVYNKADKTSPIKWVESDEKTMLHKSVNGRKKGLFSSKVERLSANVGTPEFMPPEMVYAKDSTYNEKVDVWSAAMIVFELISLDIPYRRNGFTQFELLQKIQEGSKPILPDGYIHTPEWAPVLKLFNDCIEFNPTKRPSAFDVVKRLKVLKTTLNL